MQLRHLGFGLLLYSLFSIAGEPAPPNKLVEMYRLYYLPFSMTFEQGLTTDDVLPFTLSSELDKGRVIEPEELRVLEQKYEQSRDNWRKKSLLLSTPVDPGKEVRITSRLVTHALNADKSVTEILSLSDRMELNQAIHELSTEEKGLVFQRLFVRKLLDDSDKEKFNFFLVGPDWCESSKEYRVLLETYFKDADSTKLSLHNVVLNDPKHGIFDSRALKELFPSPKKYSHESVPRFLAAEFKNGKLVLWEEADALAELYKRFLVPQRGSLDSLIPFLKNSPKKPLSASLMND